jgi:mono/diheme cytochrome c family protein
LHGIGSYLYDRIHGSYARARRYRSRFTRRFPGSRRSWLCRKIDAAELYKTNCLACHGPDGDSPLEPLSFIDDTWKHGSRLQDIVKVVTDGVDSTPMLPFKEKLTKEEIVAIAKLVRSFDKSLAAKKPAAKKPVKN